MSARAAATSGRACRVLAVLLALVLALPSLAAAQPPAAPPPTAGALYRDGQDGRYLLGGSWIEQDDPSNVGIAQGWYAPGYESTAWRTVGAPNSANAGDFSSASMSGSIYWYRRDFTLPSGAFPKWVSGRAQRWIVRLESVNYRATVWLNGVELGTHTGAYLPFEFDLRNLHAGVNTLVVRADDRRTSTDLPPGPGGGWWNFGGLQREVYLRAVAGVDISQVQVRPLLPCPSCAATVQERVVLRNLTSSPQTVSLRGRFGRRPISLGAHTIPAGKTWATERAISVTRPELWSPDHPYLYRARLGLYDKQGRPIGGYTTWSGIRSVEVTPDGRLALNGRLLNLRGVNLHEQDAIEGAALDPGRLARLIGWAHALGAGIIRAHYPLNPQLEEAADRLGILLWSEIPVYQLSGSTLGNPAVVAQAKRVLAENIRANQNHPAVLLWSIGNELPTPAPQSEARYISAAAALARQLDPTRPVGMAVSSWPGVDCQSAYEPLDVIGYNDYFGWYDAGGGSTDDRDQLSGFLDSLRQCYPTQPLMITEFGFEASRHGATDERGTYEFQNDNIAYHMNVFASKPWLSGAIYFPLQDFAVTPGWGGGNPNPSPPWLQKGLIDPSGNLKPAFGLVEQLFHGVRQIAATATVARAGAAHRSRTASASRRRS